MSEVNTVVDSLGLFLTGGASNRDPDLSLGGVTSSIRLRGMGGLVGFSDLPGVRIDNVFPACGEGEGTLVVDTSGDLVFTPPGGSAGSAVPIAAGESKIVTGADEAKAMRVFRETGLDFAEGRSAAVTLLYPLNGVMSMKNVTNAQRVAGVTTYRAIKLSAPGSYGVASVRLWAPPVSGAQAVYSLASEVPVAGVLQTIVNEETAPTALSWVTATSEGTALLIPAVTVAAGMGLWIRKVFPAAGAVAVQEDFQLAMKFNGV